MRWTTVFGTALFLCLAASTPRVAAAPIPTNFAEYGTVVNGFQDQFEGTSLDPVWTQVGGYTYSVSGGFLHVTGATTDPSKLLYTGASYDGVTQNILANIKVISASGADSRVGVAASNTTSAQGLNLMFRGAPSYSLCTFLNDLIAHGPQNTITWTTGTSYWMRILHSINKTGSDPLFNGANDLFGKVWPADGTTPEPTNYMWAWASNDSRSGFAGIQTGSNLGTASFDVGYVLIQATGLPSITVGPQAPPTPPNPPESLNASYSATTGATLTWTDKSTDETSFQIERSPANLAFSLLATKTPDTTSHVDTLLYPNIKYTYRVRAVNATGFSAWSNEASITTDATQTAAPPPTAPSGLTAEALGSDSVALKWADNSAGETGFEIVRNLAGAGQATLFGTKPDVISFADHAVHPGWPCTYRVRALSLSGPSTFSDPASFTVGATLDLTMVSGTVVDSAVVGRDSAKFKASYAHRVGGSGNPLDPAVNGLALQVGAPGSPVIVSIPEKDLGWKLKKSRATKTKPSVVLSATWKSKKGATPVVSVVIDLVKHTITATVSKAQFLNSPTGTIRTLVASGAEGGAHSSTWRQRKTVFTFVK